MSASRHEYNDLAALAAAHAALDPDRQESRCDVLIYSVLELLAAKGPLAERELLQHVKQLWSTDALDRAMLRDTLARAENAKLIVRHGLTGNVRWKATDASVLDATNDKKWAEKILLRFEQDVEVRINELIDTQTVDSSRARRLARHLFAALRTASADIFGQVVRSSDPSKIDGLRLDFVSADTYLRERVNPRPVAEALIALTRAATDPCDEFGTKIMHIIVAGQVLQGLVARRDLPETPPVSGSLLLLDTSTLVVIGAVIGWAGILFEGIRWLKDSAASALGFVLATAATISWTLLGSVVGIALSTTPAPHSIRNPVPVTDRSAASGRISVPYASFRAPKQVSGITGGGHGHIPRPQTNQLS